MRVQKRSQVARNAIASRKGFTLVEVMIASVMFLVIAFAGFGSLMASNRLIERARDETRASQVLQSEIEELRTYNWATLTALPTQSKYTPDTAFSDAYANRYSVTRRITPRMSTQRHVSIKVDWTDNGGTEHTREYVTVISENGLFDFYYMTY